MSVYRKHWILIGIWNCVRIVMILTAEPEIKQGQVQFEVLKELYNFYSSFGKFPMFTLGDGL